MKKPELYNITEKVKSFPVMSNAVAKLLRLLDDPDISAAQIEEILRYDPGLIANILKLANSAYFGFASQIGSVRQAAVLMGPKRLKQLVTASCLNSLMDKGVAGYDLPHGELWRHSIAVSVAAEDLLKELHLPNDADIFTAALLHDVGKLVLGEFIKEEINIIEAEASKGVPFIEAERIVIGTDHAEIGAKITGSWSFPSEIVGAIRRHHDPDITDEKSRLIDIVHVADVLCLMIGIGVGREGLRCKPSSLVTGRLGLKPAMMESVASRTLQSVNELYDVLQT